ncbi:ATP-binding protein [Mangrovibacterium sp.]|uniref:ATP-binding protein n=1 Tax=Mangrovibacterium sp. TaxID=1961364 RepID=UPI003562F2BE
MENGKRPGRDVLGDVMNSQVSHSNIPLVKEILSTMSDVVCILNSQREVVFANEKLLEKYSINLTDDIFGLRFGEVMNCINNQAEDSVCGTTDKCHYCGANYVFEDYLAHNKSVTKECRLLRSIDGSVVQFDLEISASPFFYQKDYMVVSINDITDKKRRDLLERIFFHDVINMAGSLSGILGLMKQGIDDTEEDFLEAAHSLSEQIIEEIKAQQQMLKAETGELKVEPGEIQMADFMNEIRDKIKYSQAAFDRNINVVDNSFNVCFVSDRVLLTRVIFNMAKNALEAIDRGGEIKIQAFGDRERVRIEVHNDSYIEADVQNQLFQRSYSTKGQDRGVGTYSMKLLGEKYLKGKVDFSSVSEKGTTFFIEIPLSL